MKKWLVFLVMALIVSAVHAVTMPWAACTPGHAPQTSSTANHHHDCDEAASSSPSPGTPQQGTSAGHTCCTGLCPHTEPFVLPVLRSHHALAPSPLLGVDLGLGSAIFKPPKSRV